MDAGNFFGFIWLFLTNVTRKVTLHADMIGKFKYSQSKRPTAEEYTSPQDFEWLNRRGTSSAVR